MSHRGIVDVRTARAILSRFLLPLEIEQAGIINASGRTLAEDILTHSPIPPHDSAAKDGYAVIAADTAGASPSSPRTLSVLSSSQPAGKTLEEGTAMRVRKDDPLPENADAVIEPASAYRPDDGAQVLILAETTPQTNVIRSGSVSSSGHVLLGQGIAIGPCEMELIASIGRHGVPVRRRPKVSIITSGSDIVDSFGEIAPGERRNSARYGLVGMVLSAGCELGRLIHVKDGRIGIARALGQCSGSDAVIVSISPRERHDLSLEAVSSAGARHFDRVQMNPGNCGFGIAHDRPVFAIESRYALEAFEAIIRPGLMMLLGRQSLDRPKFTAVLDSTLKLNPGCPHYIRAVTTLVNGAMHAKPTSDNALPNSLILAPENVEVVKRRETVEAVLLV